MSESFDERTLAQLQEAEAERQKADLNAAATGTYSIFDAYMRAGFEREEAFDLTKQTVGSIFASSASATATQGLIDGLFRRGDDD